MPMHSNRIRVAAITAALAGGAAAGALVAAPSLVSAQESTPTTTVAPSTEPSDGTAADPSVTPPEDCENAGGGRPAPGATPDSPITP